MAIGQDGSTTEVDLEQYRGELVGYCYRMLGSSSEAEDAVQETMTKAWRNLDRFEGRSSLRTWLYKIASNTCFDQLRSSQRRARPMDLSDPWAVDGPIGEILPEVTWVQPVPDRLVRGSFADPADVAEGRDSVRLAFIAALQHLPPKQRAALILCEVLRWPAAEVADLLDTTVASVNSALQRARATLDGIDERGPARSAAAGRTVDPALLERWVSAFEAYDIDSLVELFTAEAIWEMPPFDSWYRGPQAIGDLSRHKCPAEQAGDMRFIATTANGQPAAGMYLLNRESGVHEAFQLHVLDMGSDGISHVVAFMEPTLFEKFGLPGSL